MTSHRTPHFAGTCGVLRLVVAFLPGSQMSPPAPKAAPNVQSASGGPMLVEGTRWLAPIALSLVSRTNLAVGGLALAAIGGGGSSDARFLPQRCHPPFAAPMLSKSDRWVAPIDSI